MAPRRETKLTTFPEVQVSAQAASDGPPARTVSEVVAAVNKALAEPAFANVWVRGEVSGFKPASSGHWYFDLKDAGAVLNAAMFRGANQKVRFDVEDGMEVLVRGRVAVYPARSNLQIIVEEMRPVGMGELALRFEQLKRKLDAEGLFSQARKRDLPPYPRCIGIVTSLQAAALRDMLRVATQRFPGIRILVAPARVQGEGAADEIAAAIARLDAHAGCDVLIVGRGGGSIEDLWAFNEEVVVRAVAASRIPVVSAVGHETDFTLCDFAADVRAATPSNAAELVVPDGEATTHYLMDAEARIEAALRRLVPELRQRVDEMHERGQDAMRRALDKERDMLASNAARLEALSPLAVLSRGYSVARRAGKAVRTVDDADVGDDIEIITRGGTLDAKVTGKRREESP